MISIIVPVYNVEKYLEVCIESILAQTYDNYELVLIDDGSTDESGLICDRYANRFNKVKVIHQRNSGVSAARNLGIKMARGEYITFIDSDDWVEPDYIEHMVKFMTPGGFVAGHLCSDDALTIKSEGAKEMSPAEAQISVFSSKGIRGFAVAKMFDCRLLQEKCIQYCEDVAVCEDELFSIMYISSVEGVITILEYAGYHYRTSITGATLGRYGHKPPRMKDFTEITALERAGCYLVQDNDVFKAWKQRRDKAAVATLRTMVSCDYRDKAEIVKLKKIVREGCVSYVFGNVGCFSGKVSMVLSAISPKLEWKIYEKQHTKLEEKQ